MAVFNRHYLGSPSSSLSSDDLWVRFKCLWLPTSQQHLKSLLDELQNILKLKYFIPVD